MRTYTVGADTSAKGQYVQTIRQDAKGYIWFASDLNGRCRLDPGSGEIIQFLPQPGVLSSLPSRSVLDIDVDTDGLLWLATDVALVRFDPVSFEMKTYDQEWFCRDDNGAVTDKVCWVSTWAPEWAELSADAVGGPGLIDVGWVDDFPEVVGFIPDVAEWKQQWKGEQGD